MSQDSPFQRLATLTDNIRLPTVIITGRCIYRVGRANRPPIVSCSSDLTFAVLVVCRRLSIIQCRSAADAPTNLLTSDPPTDRLSASVFTRLGLASSGVRFIRRPARGGAAADWSVVDRCAVRDASQTPSSATGLNWTGRYHVHWRETSERLWDDGCPRPAGQDSECHALECCFIG